MIETGQILDAQAPQLFGTIHSSPVYQTAPVAEIISTFPKKIPPYTICAFDCPFGKRKNCHVINWNGGEH